VEAFLGEFGATLDAPARFEDAAGESLMVGRELFIDRGKGRWKVTKQDRHRALPLLAEVLRSPDEIWARMEWHGARTRAVVRRRYLARFRMAETATPGLVVFEEGEDSWWGVTAFDPGPADEEQLQRIRRGVRLYRRAG
jgi:hypothetical protein